MLTNYCRSRQITIFGLAAILSNVSLLGLATSVHAVPPQQVAVLSPDGATLVITDDDGKVEILDAATGKNRSRLAGRVFPSQRVQPLLFSPDGKTLAMADVQENKVKLWHVAERKERASLKTSQSELASPMSMAFAPDGKTLCTGARDGTVKLWDAVTGKEIALLLSSNEEAIHSAAYDLVPRLVFSADGKMLATYGQHQPVRLWEMSTHKLRAALSSPARVLAFSADGTMVLTDSLMGLGVWDTASGRKLFERDGYFHIPGAE